MRALLLSKRAWIVGAILIVFGGSLGLLKLVRDAYTGPLHCQSCHSKQTELWQGSGSHSTETQCTDCHAPWPHVVPTRANLFRQYREAVLPTSLMARDESISDNCLQCHPTVLSGSHMTSDIIVMSHRVHREEAMLCLDCHRNISHDTMSGRTYRPPKSVCYQCHLRDIDVSSSHSQSCVNCHRILLSREKDQQHMRPNQ